MDVKSISTCDTLESGLRRACGDGCSVGTRRSVTESVSATCMDYQESTCVIVYMMVPVHVDWQKKKLASV